MAIALFSGPSLRQSDGTKIRRSPHILLVGDPGMGKSDLLLFAAALAPISVYTSGKSTSAAGLTAAVVPEKGGGFRLEPGALV